MSIQSLNAYLIQPVDKTVETVLQNISMWGYNQRFVIFVDGDSCMDVAKILCARSEHLQVVIAFRGEDRVPHDLFFKEHHVFDVHVIMPVNQIRDGADVALMVAMDRIHSRINLDMPFVIIMRDHIVNSHIDIIRYEGRVVYHFQMQSEFREWLNFNNVAQTRSYIICEPQRVPTTADDLRAAYNKWSVILGSSHKSICYKYNLNSGNFLSWRAGKPGRTNSPTICRAVQKWLVEKSLGAFVCE